MSNTRAKGKSTKWWNDCLDNQPPEEKIFVDHKTEARNDPCNLKFKTSDSRLPYWIVAHNPGENFLHKSWILGWKKSSNVNWNPASIQPQSSQKLKK